MTAKGGVVQEVAGGEAGPTAGESPWGSGRGHAERAGCEPSSGASKGLGIAALILGALGLLAGLGALVVARGRKAP